MKKVAAEPYRDIDFSRAKRGSVLAVEPGKTKISIRVDNAVIDYFRGQVERASVEDRIVLRKVERINCFGNPCRRWNMV